MNYKVAGYTILLSVGFTACSKKLNVSRVFADAEKQTKVMLAEIPKAKLARLAVSTTAGTPGSEALI